MWNPDQVYAAEQARYAELRMTAEQARMARTVAPRTVWTVRPSGRVLQRLGAWFTDTAHGVRGKVHQG
ncbi:MAG TPA: hypothetical protein VFT66_00085 [Roseiflexaceae bacterium]|jgi:hypothetical protein|nr:hypothetical protein [Roseiflexaceae bacterium]